MGSPIRLHPRITPGGNHARPSLVKYEDPRYVARRYFTLDGLRASAAAIANATFAARQETIWGTGTTTVASDSTHFRAYDQNLFTEWHTRYRGRSVLIYWHVEKVPSPSTPSTSNAPPPKSPMIEGVMRPRHHHESRR